MTRWDGWSTNWAQVHLTRVLATLMAGVTGRRTTTTIACAITELRLTGLSPAAVAAALMADPAPFTLADPRGPVEAQPLKITADGARLAAEFRAGQESLARLRVAQKTVLRCCAAHPETEFLRPGRILQDPLSWLYGVHMRPEELRRASTALAGSGLVFVVGDQHDWVVQLTNRGLQCVDRYDSDPRQMQPP